MAATKLVIIGGVAGGATAAARARRLNEEAEIVVLERGPYVSFANCGLPYFVGGEIPARDALLLQTPAGLKARYNIDVRVQNEVVEIDRKQREVVVLDLQSGRTYRERYDKLILSPGASPIRPPLPGIDHPRVFSLRTIPDMDRIKAVVDAGAKSALVIGGGFIGLEMAENLRRRGLAVHLVEMLDLVMPPVDREMAGAIHDALERQGVALHLSDAVESFTDAGGRPVATLRSGARLDADLVVLAIGVKPDSKLAADAGLETLPRGGIKVDEHMRTSDPSIYAVGDAVIAKDFVTGEESLIPLAGPANRQARIAADNVFGRSSRYRGSQGTGVVRVFELTVAMTGANEKTLRRTGAVYDKIYVHPAQHVGYYPGSAPMTIKMLFSKPEGRVLGAQIIGKDGVDKRIDVLATAIQAGMTVYDLEEMELAYAPQYGAAKDPVNMAGFVAANALRGDVVCVHADALDGLFLLDVRTPQENEAGAIPNSKLIPLHELRARHKELPAGKPIGVYCQVGLRGYVAARLLRQLGYDARNVSGGYRTYCAFQPRKTAAACGGAASACGGTTKGCGGAAKTAAPGKAEAGRGSKEDGESESHNHSPAPPASSAPDETLDVRGKCCPGPIVAVAESMKALADGKVLEVLATDAGFLADIPAWCANTGNELVSAGPRNGHYVASIRKMPKAAAAPSPGGGAAAAGVTLPVNKTIVVFSGELDRVMGALIIANGAAAMGRKVTLFFTFWGLNALRRSDPPRVSKGFIERMFGWMMPRGADKLPLSNMNMAGAGKAMMKHVMRSKNVDSLPDLLAQARKQGVHLVACSMSMDVMGIKQEELIEGVEIGGVAAYLAEADKANVNLFV
jgi:NADPH-dependent 2,4-dienoyl-CoA reductase/sulfur reductase-like enzyme/peroxiredoxin family protein/TusA-related sulfurtransferase/rhodanese-related sulfurtransferase